MRRFHRRWHLIACSAALVLAFGCGQPQPGRPVPGRLMAAAASRGDIMQRGLGSRFRSRLGAAARQILASDSGSGGPPAVVVQIDPDTGSYSLSQSELDAGAVVARFRKFSPGAIRRFGLGMKDTLSYWSVSRAPNGDYIGRFTSDGMDTSYVITVEVHEEAEEGFEKVIPWRQAIAQFEYLGPVGGDLRTPRRPRGDAALDLLAVEEGGGGSVWVTCMALGCCKVQ